MAKVLPDFSQNPDQSLAALVICFLPDTSLAVPLLRAITDPPSPRGHRLRGNSADPITSMENWYPECFLKIRFLCPFQKSAGDLREKLPDIPALLKELFNFHHMPNARGQ